MENHHFQWENQLYMAIFPSFFHEKPRVATVTGEPRPPPCRVVGTAEERAERFNGVPRGGVARNRPGALGRGGCGQCPSLFIYIISYPTWFMMVDDG